MPSKRATARLLAAEPVDIESRLAPFFTLPYDLLLPSGGDEAGARDPELASAS